MSFTADTQSTKFLVSTQCRFHKNNTNVSLQPYFNGTCLQYTFTDTKIKQNVFFYHVFCKNRSGIEER